MGGQLIPITEEVYPAHYHMGRRERSGQRRSRLRLAQLTLCGAAEHALAQLLTDNPQITKSGLCLDNDKAGIQARERLILSM